MARARDPILRLAGKLKEKKTAKQGELDAIHAQVEEELAEIVKFAEESAEPDDAALCEYVYVNPMGHR